MKSTARPMGAAAPAASIECQNSNRARAFFKASAAPAATPVRTHTCADHAIRLLSQTEFISASVPI